MLRVERIEDGVVYLIGDKVIEEKEECLSSIPTPPEGRTPDYKIFVKNTNIEGVFVYGCEQLLDEISVGLVKGYVWSSRPSVMNKEFNIALVDAAYRNDENSHFTICAIDLTHLEDLLKDTEYEIDWQPHLEGRYDVFYTLKKKGS